MTTRTSADPPAESGEVTLTFSDDGRVATILVDRARKLNAFTLAMLTDLERAIAVVRDSDAAVAIIRTAGEKVFCVGADINHFADLTAPDMWRRWTATGHRAFTALAGLRQPTVAVVDGLALGGGFELALACDFRILRDTAVFGLPEVGLGTVPGWGGTERLTELIGRGRTKDIVLTGRRLDAGTALEWGVASRIATAAELELTVNTLTDDLLRGGPVAVQLAKQLIDAAADGASSTVLESLAGGLTTASTDLVEGVSAFREKRAPHFTGN